MRALQLRLDSAISDGDDTSTIVTRSSASFAASYEAPFAVFSATISTALPVDGSTTMFPLMFRISTRPPGFSS